ncbi:MAG TPA: hypothetical protein VFD21_13135 [Vicinamibacterales bacterium]|jgi:hypothetical protein|nr:hypothetical protein [Vicinamibacterales bacterium]
MKGALLVLAVVVFYAVANAQQAPAAGGRQGGGARQGGAAAAGGGRATRPPIFLKEEWKQNAANDEHPVSQESIGNPNVELKLYGKEILLTGRGGDENNPTHVWTGTCAGPCAVALRDKTNFADLSGLARIRWNTKTSGFHQVRPALKLADGTWVVGDRADGSTRDWLFTEFNLADVRWLRLDIERVVTTGNILPNVDLSKVDEIGFADLMPGSGHGAGGWVDVAQIEVYGKPVAR